MFAPIEEIFCEIDDFCKLFLPEFERYLLPSPDAKTVRRRALSMAASEIMTILVLFHMSWYRNFKRFYLDCVVGQLKGYFPRLLSYTRFVEIQKRVMPALCIFMRCKAGKETDTYYIDSTALAACHNKRIKRHKTFKGLATRGHTSMGWFYGFKLHLVINNIGQIMAFSLTPGNTDDRKPVATLLKDLQGITAGDKGYISASLTGKLKEKGMQLVTRVRKNMKAAVHSALEALVLSKRGIVETVIEQLQSICHIDHTRHRSPDNFVTNMLAGLIAYAFKPTKPSVSFDDLKNMPLIPN
jgi:hypothetical protein